MITLVAIYAYLCLRLWEHYRVYKTNTGEIERQYQKHLEQLKKL